jgi:PleD family two-component response regulator
MDVRMPIMDGFETATLIRQRERSRYTPIIFISALSSLEWDIAEGFPKGAIDYIVKPVIPQVLKSKVEVFVNLFHLHERLKQQAVQQSKTVQ